MSYDSQIKICTTISPIPERIKDEINFLIRNKIEFDGWLAIKKYLLKSIPSPMRKYFSTRDDKTKRQQTNEFERKLIDYYEKESGKKVEA